MHSAASLAPSRGDGYAAGSGGQSRRCGLERSSFRNLPVDTTLRIWQNISSDRLLRAHVDGSAFRMRLTCVDLFCGAGGFSEGFRQAGFQVTAALDNWAPAVLTHEKNHPETKA